MQDRSAMSSRVLAQSKRVRFSGQNIPISSSQKSSRQAKKNNKKREDVRRRKAWDSTISDLSVHKLSPEEVEQRHKSHQSKNAELAKHDLYERAKENLDLDNSGNLRPSPLTTRGSALLRQLQGKELHEVLAESDKALRVVKDMFGDDPMRYSCQPNVTVAPHIAKNKANLERTLQESQRDGPTPTALASPGGIRDESIQELAPRKPALNELLTPQGSDGDQSVDHTSTPQTTPQAHRYKSSLDLKRFQKLIAKEEKQATKDVPTSEAPNPDPLVATHPLHKTSSGAYSSTSNGLRNRPPKTLPSDTKDVTRLTVHVPKAIGGDTESLSGLSEISSIPGSHLEAGGEPDPTLESDTSVLLDNGPVTRPPPEHPLHVAHKMTSTKRQENPGIIHEELDKLEKIVQSVSQELHEYEQTTTSPTAHTVTPANVPHTPNDTFTRITTALLTSVTKIAHYLRDSEAQLKGEVEVRGVLLQTMTEQQNLMDALTSDVVKLQKENRELKKALKEVQHTTSEQLLSMQKEVSDVHKKLSTLAIQSLQPNQYWSNKLPPLSSSITVPTQWKSLDSLAVTCTPSIDQRESVVTHTITQPLATTNTPEGKTEGPFYLSPTHTGEYTGLNAPSVTSHKQPPLYSAPSPLTQLHQVSLASEHAQGSTPFIQAQQSPLSYSGTTSFAPVPSINAQHNIGHSSTSINDQSKLLSTELAPSSTMHGKHSPMNNSYAPPPPSLSVALQVPPLSKALTSNTTTTEASVPSTTSTSINGPMFDVADFLTSLGKLEHLPTVEQNSYHTQHTPTTANMLTTDATHSSGTTCTQPPKSALSAPVVSNTVATQHVLQAPDLSMSLCSFVTDTEQLECNAVKQDSRPVNAFYEESKNLYHTETSKQQHGWFALTSHIAN